MPGIIGDLVLNLDLGIRNVDSTMNNCGFHCQKF